MHDLSTDQLAGLAERILSGDRSAEDELIRYFAPRIFALLCTRTHNREASRDLLQDVVIVLLRAFRQGELREPNKTAAFVLGVARNVAQSFLRDGRLSREEPLGDEPAAQLAEDTVEVSQREAHVSQAMNQLDPIDRDILRMTLLDGLKPGVIAAKLGLSSEVVRQRKFRATKKVAEFVRSLSRTAASPPHD